MLCCKCCGSITIGPVKFDTCQKPVTIREKSSEGAHMKTDHGIPLPALRRLPIYYRRLRQAVETGISYVSSDELGQAADVPGVQVRKDLGCLSQYGRPGGGY